MLNACLTVCSTPGCPNVGRRGACPEHSTKRWERWQRSQAEDAGREQAKAADVSALVDTLRPHDRNWIPVEEWEGKMLRIGDRMRWSLTLAQELLRRQSEQPEGVDAVVVEVVDIRPGDNGEKIVVMKTIDATFTVTQP